LPFFRIKHIVLFLEGGSMRKINILLAISVLVLATLACKTITGLKDAQPALPSVVTLIAPMETEAAGLSTPVPANPNTNPNPAQGDVVFSSGLGISLDSIKKVMETTQLFTFTEGEEGGQPATIVGLNENGSASMPGVSERFLVKLIGDPNDLGEIRMTIPYSDDQASVQAGIGMMTMLFSSILPPNALFSLIPWLSEHYSKIQVGDSEELVVNQQRFVLSRPEMDVNLSITPAK
jgi:hypothetical protein